ncbi:hypothetical protein HY971_04380 [Candidatus Kaiserbacteria bacterium]|nr:hypothetical protein [Candidatus Kaiserbacteria bacterium]
MAMLIVVTQAEAQTVPKLDVVDLRTVHSFLLDDQDLLAWGGSGNLLSHERAFYPEMETGCDGASIGAYVGEPYLKFTASCEVLVRAGLVKRTVVRLQLDTYFGQFQLVETSEDENTPVLNAALAATVVSFIAEIIRVERMRKR